MDAVGLAAGVVSLAQAAGASQADSVRKALVWAGILGGAVIVLGVIMLVLRARTLGRRDGGGEASIFEDLRRMRDRGEISVEEYERTRRSMAERLRTGTPVQRIRATPITASDARVVTVGEDGEEVRARSGYDLTGMPLPGAEAPPGEAPDTDASPPTKGGKGTQAS